MLIKEKDVITLLVPYPTKESALASNSHMYICEIANEGDAALIKCETFKIKFLAHPPVRSFVKEYPSIERNPFVNPTLIDCDKDFHVTGVYIPEKLLAKRRRNICDPLFSKVVEMLDDNGHESEELNPRELMVLNAAL